MISRDRLENKQRKGIKREKMRRIHECDPLDTRRVGIAGTTGTPCSCWMCGNPRKYGKGEERLTMQERRFWCR